MPQLWAQGLTRCPFVGRWDREGPWLDPHSGQGQPGPAPHSLPRPWPQLEGAFPDTMTKCAELLNRTVDVDFVDINVGCPIDLVYKKVVAAQPWTSMVWVGMGAWDPAFLLPECLGDPWVLLRPGFPHLAGAGREGWQARLAFCRPLLQPPISPRAGAVP